MAHKPKHTEAEMQQAEEAIARARAAMDANDVGRFLECLKDVPNWVFMEDPDTRKKMIQAIPVALGVLRDLAEDGNEEAADLLFRMLQEHPEAGSLIPERKPPR
jgi:hypothetical protein